jgi:hypothetical protein
VAGVVAVELGTDQPDELVIDLYPGTRQLVEHLIHHRQELDGGTEIGRRRRHRHQQGVRRLHHRQADRAERGRRIEQHHIIVARQIGQPGL